MYLNRSLALLLSSLNNTMPAQSAVHALFDPIYLGDSPKVPPLLLNLLEPRYVKCDHGHDCTVNS